uniref:Putative HIT-like protein n=1 Tax=Aegilops tauschii TaxID=37682 RepID=M8AVN9_AEGTA
MEGRVGRRSSRRAGGFLDRRWWAADWYESLRRRQRSRWNEAMGEDEAVTLAQDDEPDELYEDDVCICILDSHPLALGHSLIIPKCHFSSMEVTPPHVIAAMCSKVPFLSNAIMKATDCDAFNLVVNNGEAAGQVIFHTHFHIIPRRSGDKLWPTESFRRSSIEPNETSSLISCIKEQLDSSED